MICMNKLRVISVVFVVVELVSSSLNYCYFQHHSHAQVHDVQFTSIILTRNCKMTYEASRITVVHPY